jgi:hypothetical protein
MKQFIRKILCFFIVLGVIIPEGFWGTSFALSSTWDFNTGTDYTFSNTGEVNVL